MYWFIYIISFVATSNFLFSILSFIILKYFSNSSIIFLFSFILFSRNSLASFFISSFSFLSVISLSSFLMSSIFFVLSSCSLSRISIIFFIISFLSLLIVLFSLSLFVTFELLLDSCEICGCCSSLLLFFIALTLTHVKAKPHSKDVVKIFILLFL